MLIDAHNLFSNAQALTATAASTNYMDLGPLATGNLQRNLGVGENIYFVSIVTTAFTDASSNSTITVTLEVDDNTSFSTPTTAQTIGIFAALSAVGTRLVARLQPDAINERYLQVKYTTTNGDLTTGAVTSFLTHSIDAWRAYKNNSTITT